MPDAFGLAAIVTKFALYLGVMTAAGTVFATVMFRLKHTRGLVIVFGLLAADVGHRFGFVASVTVPVLILVGGYMGYQLVGSFSALIGTGYGQAMILKVLLVAGLLGLAAANKLRFIPALRSGDPAAARHLSKSISIEWLVILAVLGVTALLTTHLTLPA